MIKSDYNTFLTKLKDSSRTKISFIQKLARLLFALISKPKHENFIDLLATIHLLCMNALIVTFLPLKMSVHAGII